MSAEVNILFNLQGHERVDVSRQENKSVIRAQRLAAFKFINISAASEAKSFKNGERSVNGKAVYIHLARLLDDMMGVVILIDRNGDSVRRIRDLRNRVDNKSVVLFAVI